MPPRSEYDAVIIGSGPNGLTAAACIAASNRRVLVLEAAPTLGGGVRTEELTLPGYLHDVCSGCHPTGILSPAFKHLELDKHGLQWVASDKSFGHPLDDGPAAIAFADLDTTVDELGGDGPAWRALVEPYLDDPDPFFADLLGPLGVPRQPVRMLHFGTRAVRPATMLANGFFADAPAKALFAGAAAHANRPLDQMLTGAVGLVFAISAHIKAWPVAKGGSGAIADALVSVIRSHGGELVTDHPVTTLDDLPPSRAIVLDLAPRQIAEIAGDHLPARYKNRLLDFEYGPGSFKCDWALSGPIPWKDERLADCATVHVGGPMEEVAAAEKAAWLGEHTETPFVLLCQQSALDPTRAPTGKHTGYAYCHVPPGSDVDRTDGVEAQIERFAPGFKDLIEARHTRTARGFEAYNPSLVGGAVTGGPGDWKQLFTRPVAARRPHRTPNPAIFLCSQYTPPGGGVHGMCGWFAARDVIVTTPQR